MMGIWHTLISEPRKRLYYVAPTKALVNQIYCDIRGRFCMENQSELFVGVHTGEIKFNLDAQVRSLYTELDGFV